jgi:hypothetical protein
MGKPKDYTGQKFGRLTFKKNTGEKRKSGAYVGLWLIQRLFLGTPFLVGVFRWSSQRVGYQAQRMA